jgi:GNAT superfamily N-acetyltransferase
MREPEPPQLRLATPLDLEQVWDIRFANDVAGAMSVPERREPPPYLTHLLEHGTLLIATFEERIAGYAGRVDRGGVAYLTDLFVDPAHQSASVGRSLLRRIFADDPARRCTMASSDFRALALYTRAGMTPRWPNVLLRATAESRLDLVAVDVVMVPADVDDPELRFWDQASSGRLRPEDLQFFVRGERGKVSWFRRGTETVGYGIVRLGAGRLWYPDAATIGPVGIGSAEDAIACVVAAVTWARERSPDVELAVPGPHPALRPLLESGFAIEFVETYCASDPALVDPTRYVGSGGDLF